MMDRLILKKFFFLKTKKTAELGLQKILEGVFCRPDHDDALFFSIGFQKILVWTPFFHFSCILLFINARFDDAYAVDELQHASYRM